MNRAEVVAAAVEHLLPTSRLLLFGELASVGAPCQELSMVLSSYRPSDLVTGGGRFRSDDVAVSGIGLHGDWIWQVTWEDLARALSAVLTADRVEDLASAYRASLSGSDAGRERLAATRSILAHDVIEAAGLIPPSLFRDTLVERVIVDPADSDTPFPVRVTLDPVDDQRVTCRVNGQAILTLSAVADPHRVAVTIESIEGPPGFAGTVRHVPLGDSPGPLPASFADRVGAEILDDSGDARWAMQVDGFDVVLFEAAWTVPARVHTTVYDNDPAEPFVRDQAERDMPPTVTHHAGAPPNRFTSWPGRSPSPGREL